MPDLLKLLKSRLALKLFSMFDICHPIQYEASVSIDTNLVWYLLETMYL